jgi:S-adenosylmethionine:tRNA ribosyltransferase-isomerase
LHIDRRGELRHGPRSRFIDLLKPGDLVIANDAATLPASLSGIHSPTGEAIEIRLAGRRSLGPDDVREFSAIVFGGGNFRIRTEDRPLPPVLGRGDQLVLGPLCATVERLLNHPRLASIRFDGSPDEIWQGLARHGRPIQYAHVSTPLALWDVWTPIAGPPVAFEPPSAGFTLDWRLLSAMAARGIRFATLTHAAGLSSTGDLELDALLPFDEPYRIPGRTAAAIRRARAQGNRVIAIGTTVVRALEHAASVHDSVIAGESVATQRIGPETPLCAVDAILSGAHEPGSSHYELLRAFTNDKTLRNAAYELDAHGYTTHEFGDSVFIERRAAARLYQKPTRAATLAIARSANRGDTRASTSSKW